jgi:hypothetical protein
MSFPNLQVRQGATCKSNESASTVQDLDLRTLSACDKQPGVYS